MSATTLPRPMWNKLEDDGATPVRLEQDTACLYLTAEAERALLATIKPELQAVAWKRGQVLNARATATALYVKLRLLAPVPGKQNEFKALPLAWFEVSPDQVELRDLGRDFSWTRATAHETLLDQYAAERRKREAAPVSQPIRMNGMSLSVEEWATAMDNMTEQIL